MNCFHQQTPGRAQLCLTVQQILGSSTQGNAINLARKILIFFVTKKLPNGIELRQDLYLSMCKLSNLSPRLSHSVFFSVDPFFRRRRPRNITGAVAGNPRFHHRKSALCETVFNTPFQITIVRSYRAAVFVFMLTVLAHAVIKPYGVSLTG